MRTHQPTQWSPMIYLVDSLTFSLPPSDFHSPFHQSNSACLCNLLFLNPTLQFTHITYILHSVFSPYSLYSLSATLLSRHPIPLIHHHGPSHTLINNSAKLNFLLQTPHPNPYQPDGLQPDLINKTGLFQFNHHKKRKFLTSRDLKSSINGIVRWENARSETFYYY
ncbi:hypothetical protein CROQUDRAFT_251177 [Cronartium quercuum f. sp. fusiforme G11]|uniref:Uncharacterized protein n=1 Tax=Cronartium quercuum f. sp. fusiforme G11 TaxID=708437 RepID=A0A9P6T935_9BASI|nr:hypothetical protein CROQUDRAFT_251177 [Cronartium quercuum f. sp. fusiforme G11]